MESPFHGPGETPGDDTPRRRAEKLTIPRSLRHRAPVLWLLLPFMTGLVLGRLVPALPVWALIAIAAGATGAALAFAKKPMLWATCLCLGLVAGGAAYYGLRRARMGVWDSLPPREARLTLAVERSFQPSPDGKRVSSLARVVGTDAHLRELEGQRVYFSLKPLPGQAPLLRSTEISVVGLLQTLPSRAPLNTFDGYLSNAGVNFRLARGRIVSLSREPTAYRQFCARMQRRLAAILSLGLEDQKDLAAVSRAMLLGLQQELNEEQTGWFMQSGTMHLFSVSGLHIAVIAVALEGLLVLFRLPRAARFLLSAALLWLYVDITGAAPAAVRAYAMVMMLKASLVLRLPVNAVATLAFSALLALLVDPMTLFSASFQMSYGIVGALLLLGLPWGDLWMERWQLFRLLPKPAWRWWHHAIAWVQQKSLATIAAGLATGIVSIVCGVVYFGLFTPGSILANLVLIPTGSLAIEGGFASLLCGLCGLDRLTILFNHATALLIWLSERGIDVFVDVPGVFWKASFRTTATGFVALTLLLASLLWGYHHRWELRRGGIWPPFVIAALALVFCVKSG